MEKRFLGFFACLLFSSSMVFAGECKRSPADDSAAVDPITNFSQVTPGLYRGARPLDSGLQYLAGLKVRTDIDLQGGDLIKIDPGLNDFFEEGEKPENIAKEKATATSLGMTFYNEPLSSFFEVSKKEDREIDQTLLIMHDPAAQPVYIHCEHGVDRTGMLVALYEIKYMGYTVDQAHQEWEAHGHNGFGQVATHELDDYFNKKAREILRGKSQ